MLFWTFQSDEHKDAGAIPPEPMSLPFGKQQADSPFRGGDFRTKWSAIEAGYKTLPSDCPPVRLLSRYGFIVRSPGRVQLTRREVPIRERVLEDGYASYGLLKTSGDAWPGSDSGLIASWILGSEFAKIHTGINVLFPKLQCLFQGPIPNASLMKLTPNLDVMAGIEYCVPSRMQEISGTKYGVANMNIIVRLPSRGNNLELERGDLLAWFFPVLSPKGVQMEALRTSDR